jgi:EAL domain-containing protein (putative c-di-GMP-specific phosphodiesterase class I)
MAAEKIRRALAKPFEFASEDMFITASIGISVYPADGHDVSTLLRHAESAMYRAKRGGSLGYEFYEPGMEATMSEYLRLDSALRRAIERNELMVYYQPKAEIASGNIIGAEALVRWLHPSRGMIPPLEFIPLAEETGLINPIGEFVLRTACLQAQAWLQAGLPDINMAVNISGIQLQERGFIELVASVLQQTELPPRHLTLEITESVLMSHARDAVSTLSQLKALGVRIEIDDFGTGYSSLAYLKRFPVDALKIDRTFTRDMTTSADDTAIVAGIIALAHSLRLQVIAEGVETQAQRDQLIRLDCDFMQGYYLSQPLPPAQLADEILRDCLPDAYFVAASSA